MSDLINIKDNSSGFVPYDPKLTHVDSNNLLCPKCGKIHTGACWPYPTTVYTYISPPDLSQIPMLITEMRETRQALERLIKLVESWQGDGK